VALATNLGQPLGEPKTLAAEIPGQREQRRLRQENDYLRRQGNILKKLSASYRPLCRQTVSTDGNALKTTFYW
jgi:hypothetical protein